VSFSIKVDTRDLDAKLNTLGGKAPLAMSRAINRTIGTVQTHTVRAIAADTKLAQKDVRKGLELQRATPRRLVATLTASSRRLVLYAFKARQTKAGVSYNLGGGRAFAPGAFIAKMRSGHVGVFRRRTSGPGSRPERRGPAPHFSWLPIDELQGPSMGRVFKKLLENRLVREAKQLMAKNLAHEVKFLLRGRG
jgi:hypothetical protein